VVPPWLTFKYPWPEKLLAPPVEELEGGMLEVGVPAFGMYFTPVAGQFELGLSGSAAMNDPVCTEPITS
jgi:hypothetical protein